MMPLMLLGTAVTIACAMMLVMARCFKGPTREDRILATNTFGSYVTLFIALLTCFKGNESLIDVALIYGLTTITATVAFLTYVKQAR